MDSSFARRARLLLGFAGAILVAGCNSDPVVWPISGDAAGDWTLLSSTYGPRIRAESEDETYEFHRGIDILVPERTDVHSIAAGTVQLIEQITDVGGMRVQIQHDGYVSNYMHLLKVEVDVGDVVDPGDFIATSGTPTEGEPHLHFEIRQPGMEQSDCVHPFRVLPYYDRGAPALEMGAIDMTVPMAPKVTVRVVVRNRELDLVRISAATFEAPLEALLDGLLPLSEQSWDMEQWNREKTTTISTDSMLINDPAPNGIELHPEKYTHVSSEQSIEFTFTKLVGPLDSSLLRVRVEAEDISGNVAVVTGP
ncbi:MAG: M23 family metallopeptidase [Polyangiaceae bacterium]|nr:M23 family metallopeptidase [Polyangiaceae bacterium]